MGHDAWGHVDVVPRVDGRTLVLDPAAVAVRSRYLTALTHRLPALRIALPRSIPSAHITSVTVDDGCVVVEGVYEEWRWELAHRQLDELLRRINRFDGGVLRVPRNLRELRKSIPGVLPLRGARTKRVLDEEDEVLDVAVPPVLVRLVGLDDRVVLGAEVGRGVSVG